MIFKINHYTLFLLYYYSITIKYYTLTASFLHWDAMQPFPPSHPGYSRTLGRWLHIKYVFNVGLSAALIMETAIR